MPITAPDWLFLDLDNTLWDFDGNAEDALSELFHRHHLHLRSGFDVHGFVALYKIINETFWKRYEAGEIGKDFLRTQRFTQTFLEMGIPPEDHPENAWEEYLAICPTLKKVVPGAMEFLEFAARNVPVGIITNGFENTQKGKLEMTGMARFVRFVVNSETEAAAKPQKEIFDAALRRAGTTADRALYIGDTLSSDIYGSIGAGIQVIWFNPSELDVPVDLSEEVLFLGQETSLDALRQRLSRELDWV
jgi:putative hydrolase of the HAD superfamily